MTARVRVCVCGQHQDLLLLAPAHDSPNCARAKLRVGNYAQSESLNLD